MVQLLLDNGSNPNLRAKGNKLASEETKDKEVGDVRSSFP